MLLAAKLLVAAAKPPKANSHERRRLGERLAAALADDEKAGDLLARAAAMVDRVAQGDFHRDSIRTEGFTERLRAEF